MPQEKPSCPPKGTLDVIVHHLPTYHLAATYLEGKAYDKFRGTLKMLFEDENQLNGALEKLRLTPEEFSYLDDLYPDFIQAAQILTTIRTSPRQSALLDTQTGNALIISRFDQLIEVATQINKILEQQFPQCIAI